MEQTLVQETELCQDEGRPEEPLCTDCDPDQAGETSGYQQASERFKQWLVGCEAALEGRAVGRRGRARRRSTDEFGYERWDEESEPEVEGAVTTSHVMVVRGPSGSGKTQLVRSVCSALSVRVIEIGADQPRSGAAVRKLVTEATQSRSVLSEGPRVGRDMDVDCLLLFDEVTRILSPTLPYNLQYYFPSLRSARRRIWCSRKIKGSGPRSWTS